MSTETMRSAGSQDEEAQAAYVLGMDALAALCRQLASEGGLPLSWAVQGMLDAFTGTCRCDLPARERARSRRRAVPPASAWRLACLEGVAGVGYRVVRHGEGAPIQPGDTLCLRVAGWAEDGTWLTPWTTPDVQSVHLSQMLPALAAILLRERVGARVVACLPVSVLYGAPAGQALLDGGGQTLVLDMAVVARDAQAAPAPATTPAPRSPPPRAG